MSKKKAEIPPALRYVGPGVEPGIPADDLSPADIERHAASSFIQRRLPGGAAALVKRLLDSGFYVVAAETADESPKE